LRLSTQYIWLFLFCFVLQGIAQQQSTITATLNGVEKTLEVEQNFVIINNSDVIVKELVFNDWNHAFSDKYSPLGRRFSDQYIRSFHLSPDKDRGSTVLSCFKINDSLCAWSRFSNHLDVIKIDLKVPLLPNQSVKIEVTYTLKIPNAKFTNFGEEKGNYYLKNCFLSLARLSKNGEFSCNSNEDFEDISNANYSKIILNLVTPKDYFITSDLNATSETISNQTKTAVFEGNNRNEFQFAIEKNNTFKTYTNDILEVQTNLKDSKLSDIEKMIVIDTIVKFVTSNLGDFQHKKIMISQSDYDKSPFYGLNQLPSFLSPFSNKFLYEIKFLKAYLYNYLKASLNINQREDGYIFDAMQVYVMMKYIDQNHPDLKLSGNLSSFKILKSYKLFNTSFNSQYQYLYLLMARDNLDQNIGLSKVNFIKFNEQIAGKYKAGLSFRYLDNYLQKDIVTKSFQEFVLLNKTEQTNRKIFENCIVKNANQDVSWFFSNLINSRNIIDYQLKKVQLKNNNDSIKVTVQNKSTAIVPITISGLKNGNLVFTNWLYPVKKDSIFTIKNQNIDKLVLNYNNEIPEFNSRNNYKSLKGFFSFNRPIKFNFFEDIEEPEYTQIFYLPEIGYNLYDGIIISLGLNNKSFIEKKITYDVSPSYSTLTKSITGAGSFSYRSQFRDQKMYEIKYGLSSSYFHYFKDASYFKITPSLLFKFRDENFRDNKRQFLSIRNVFVDKEDISKYTTTSTATSPLKYSIFNVKYLYKKAELIKGFVFATDVQFAKDFGKLSGEIAYRKLLENNYQFGLRFFAGSFLYNNTVSNFYSFSLDRPNDYLFDYNYYGRSESSGLFSQQIIIAEGGFKSKFTNPYANKWITSLNATSSLWHWIEMYADVGLYKNKGENVQFKYDTGIHLDLVPGYFELFFPVYSSNGFEMGQKNYQEKVRFIVTINPKTLLGLFTRKWF